VGGKERGVAAVGSAIVSRDDCDSSLKLLNKDALKCGCARHEAHPSSGDEVGFAPQQRTFHVCSATDCFALSPSI
jgi:hypothetical protein